MTFKTFLQRINSPLGNKFTIFFILFAAIPVLVLGSTALLLIDVSHRHDVSSLELQLIDQKIEEIEKFLADTLGILELRVGYTQTSEIEYSQQEFLLEGLLQENSAFEEVSFIGLSGEETAKRIRTGGVPELFDVSLLPKFRSAVAGKRFVGEVYYTLSGPFITLAAPVRNRTGEIIQVLSAEVNLSRMVSVVEKAVLGAGGYVMLVDQNGALIAAGALGARTGMDLVENERVGEVLSGRVMDGLAERDRYTSMFDGTPVVGAGKRIADTGWAILVEWPLADADAVIAAVRNQVITMTVFSIVAVLLLAPFFVMRLLRPIRKLEDGVRAIEQGDFTKTIQIQTRDELEGLGESFNKMTHGLKRLQELKNEFVFIAAHELRAPVTVIRGYISLVFEEGKNLSENIKKYLAEADKANQRLLQLVQDLLEVARSEAGRIEIKSAAMSITDTVKDSVSELSSLAKEKAITLHYDTSQTYPRVRADASRVKEIMINLAGNAIKYTPQNGSVWISHELKNKALVTHVKDDGFGIAKDAQEKLFEKFYRIHTDKTRDIQGTGLGLFIVKELVERMGGKIWVESPAFVERTSAGKEEGKGSTFSFSLPLA